MLCQCRYSQGYVASRKMRETQGEMATGVPWTAKVWTRWTKVNAFWHTAVRSWLNGFGQMGMTRQWARGCCPLYLKSETMSAVTCDQSQDSAFCLEGLADHFICVHEQQVLTSAVFLEAHHFKWTSSIVQNLYKRTLRDNGDCVLGVNEDTCTPNFQFWQEVARQYAAISSGGFNITKLGCREGVDTFWNWG